MCKRNGFTLVELVIIMAVLGLLSVGGCWVFRGAAAQVSDNLIVNPFHSSTAKIQVLTTYFGSNGSGNIYRVYAKVVADSDAGACIEEECPHETFEIEDSFIDGNYRTADIFGELKSSEQTKRVFEVELRGERSGVSGTGSFRQIHSAVEVVVE